jgi:hypothetical protein
MEALRETLKEKNHGFYGNVGSDIVHSTQSDKTNVTSQSLEE